MDLASSLATSLTDNDVVRKSYQSILEFFFSDNTPSVPGAQRVEFDNDTILSSEFPPNPPEIGRVIEEDESSFARVNYNWMDRKEIANIINNGEIEFRIGQPPAPALRKVKFAENAGNNDDENAESAYSSTASLQFSPLILRENSKLIIKHCEIVNARMNFQTGEIAATGSRFVDLYVYEKNNQSSILAQDSNNQNDFFQNVVF